jgi:hypothetical protein
MQHHPKNEHVARWGCLAISELIKDNRHNKQSIRDNGGCELIVHALRAHRYSSIASITIEAACIAIYNMALNNPTNKSIFGKAGCVEGILEALELHQKSLETAYACCIALFQVCYGIDDSVVILCFSGAAEILTNIVQKYSDVKSITASALSIMVLMSSHKNLVGQHKLTTAGVCKIIPQLIQRYDRVENLCLLLCALITTLTYKNPKNKSFLGQCGVCKNLVHIIERQLSIVGSLDPSRPNSARRALPGFAQSLDQQSLTPMKFECDLESISSDVNEAQGWRELSLDQQHVVSRDNVGLDSGKGLPNPRLSLRSRQSTQPAQLQDFFSPFYVHPSITGMKSIARSRAPSNASFNNLSNMNSPSGSSSSPLGVNYGSDMRESEILLEEAVRAFGNMIVDHEGNKSKVLSIHNHVLDILRSIVANVTNSQMQFQKTNFSQHNSVDDNWMNSQNIRGDLKQVRLVKLVTEIIVQLTIKN